jgi:hypothetical protein
MDWWDRQAFRKRKKPISRIVSRRLRSGREKEKAEKDKELQNISEKM